MREFNAVFDNITLEIRNVWYKNEKGGFNSELKKVMVDGQPLFASVTPANIRSQAGPSAWDFEAVLRRSENP